MKIVNIEDGVKKVYVQKQDIMMMRRTNSLLPVEVMEKSFGQVFIVCQDNRYEFEEFVDPNTVEFFEGCDWIPDFRKYYMMTEEEIMNAGQAVSDTNREMIEKLSAMHEADDKYEELLMQYERSEHKMYGIADILFTKSGRKEMPFPVVPDYEGFSFAEQNNCPYVARQGLNPLQVLIYRVDGKELNPKTEVIPQGLVQGTESVLINTSLEQNEFFGERFERTRELSKDSKYLVTTFKIVQPEKEKSVSDTKEQKPIGLIKKIKNIINRKKSN